MGTIKFINHASVLISDGKNSILTDPWYFGTAFDNGWSLLHQNSDSEIRDLLDEVNYIWISHEHPDHFSVPFFKKYLEKIKKNKISIIFQKTKDQRVKKFLNINKLKVYEIDDKEEFEINNKFKIKVIKSDFYDSSLLLDINGYKIFNLNDCPISSKKEIMNFKKKYGSCDLLLTQFSYAAWKGGKSNIEWMVNSAQNKIHTLVDQSNILEAKFTIPFASYIYFSNDYNFYLNSYSNKIKELSNIKNTKSNIIIMSPNEKQDFNNIKQNNSSISFWENKYADIKNLPKTNFDETVPLEDIYQQIDKYKKDVFKVNSKLLIFLISLIPFLGAFKDLKIKLIDHNKIINFNFFKRVTLVNDQNNYNIEMHSKSFYFLVKNSFGFDTLTVNGCFDIRSKKSFNIFAKNFAIGNLNNLGIKLNAGIIFNYKIFLLFFEKVKKVNDYL
tara:strand:- start:2804 stop:4132 length:1329 start_codon:yes stop_codon:yes gene_type:complete